MHALIVSMVATLWSCAIYDYTYRCVETSELCMHTLTMHILYAVKGARSSCILLKVRYYNILIAIVERDTRKYHEFIAGYCLRVRSTSKQYPRLRTSDIS